MRLYTTGLILLAVGLTGCGSSTTTPEPTPAPFQASIGTYLRQGTIGDSEANLATGLATTLSDAKGNPPAAPVTLEITGPTGWNGNEPVTATYPAGAHWYVQSITTTTPDPGAYSVKVLDGELKGQKLTVTFQNTKASLALTSPKGQFSAQKLNLAWTAVSGAAAYYATAMDATTGTSVGEAFTKSAAATLTGTLNPSHNYYAVVYAANFDVTSQAPTLPAQLMVSESIGPVGITAARLRAPRPAGPAGFGR